MKDLNGQMGECVDGATPGPIPMILSNLWFSSFFIINSFIFIHFFAFSASLAVLPTADRKIHFASVQRF